MVITSIDNKKIKDLLKLKQKKYRDLNNKFLIETENLIKEAYINSLLEEVYLLEGESLSFEVDVPIYYVSEKVFEKIKSINTSKVVGISMKKNSNEYIGKRYLMLDKISDPGNLGTILRSALAFNIDTVIISNDSCDVYNDKVVRATEGAIFSLNIIEESLETAITNLQKLNINIYKTDVTKGSSLSKIDKNNFCIIMGNEGSGIRKEIKEMNFETVNIETSNVESLNVAVATSIILYELYKKN